MGTLGLVKAAGRCGLVVGICTLAWAIAGDGSWLAADEPDTVTEADQGSEAAKLYGAIQTFQEFAALPPSTADAGRLKRFVRKAFPKVRAGSLLPETLPDAAEALPFWLVKLGTDPRMPFADEKSDDPRYSFYTFAENRLKDGRYYPTSDFKTDPYVYFCADDYARSKYKDFEPYYVPDAKKPGGKLYLAPETCQIIGPGKDGKLGRGGSLLELSEEDRDNVVSFGTVVVAEIDLEDVESGDAE